MILKILLVISVALIIIFIFMLIFTIIMNKVANECKKQSEDDLKYEDVLKRLHDIFFTFYYYMDFLAIEMLEMNKFVAQIYKRFTEDETFRKLYIIPSDKKEIKDLIQNYVVGILVEKYKKVEGGKYSDTAEQIKAKNDSFVEKVNKLTESINML